MLSLFILSAFTSLLAQAQESGIQREPNRIGRVTPVYDKPASLALPVANIIRNCKNGQPAKFKKCKAVSVNGNMLAQGCSGHLGEDYPRSNKGKNPPPIYAVEGGTVTFAGWYKTYGNRVVIDHGGGKFTTYSHLAGKPAVRRGQKISQSTILGTMGATGGTSTGKHLHFEMIKGGQFVKPNRAYSKFCG